MTQANRAIIATAARAAPTPIPAFAPSFREEVRSTVADDVLVAVTVALETLIEPAVVAGCWDGAAAFVADCEDAAASNCWGGEARNVSFVGLLQALVVRQQAHRFVLEL